MARLINALSATLIKAKTSHTTQNITAGTALVVGLLVGLQSLFPDWVSDEMVNAANAFIIVVVVPLISRFIALYREPEKISTNPSVVESKCQGSSLIPSFIVFALLAGSLTGCVVMRDKHEEIDGHYVHVVHGVGFGDAANVLDSNFKTEVNEDGTWKVEQKTTTNQESKGSGPIVTAIQSLFDMIARLF